MIDQKLVRLCSFLIIVCANQCFATIYNLINDNLRLAAFGNLDLVVEDYENEINAYDFGESSAGLIEDNNGSSQIYLPAVYGFTVFGDTLSNDKTHGYRFLLNTVFKIPSRFAIGNSFSKSDASAEYGPYNASSNVYYDTLVIGYKVNRGVNIGFRGGYYKVALSAGNESEPYYKVSGYVVGPAFLINPMKTNWQFGLNYQLSKSTPGYTSHNFTIPVIYQSSPLRLGLKVHLATVPHDTPDRSFEFRSTYQIPFNENYIRFGLLLKGIAPYRSEEYYYVYTSDFAMNIGTGIALVNNKIGLIGLQYKINTYKTGSFFFDDTSQTVWENYLNLGAELCLINNLPLRIGYGTINTSSSGFNPTYDFVTAGFGFKIPNSKFEIDFAYNKKTMKYSVLGNGTITDTDHIFGLSGRYIF